MNGLENAVPKATSVVLVGKDEATEDIVVAPLGRIIPCLRDLVMKQEVHKGGKDVRVNIFDGNGFFSCIFETALEGSSEVLRVPTNELTLDGESALGVLLSFLVLGVADRDGDHCWVVDLLHIEIWQGVLDLPLEAFAVFGRHDVKGALSSAVVVFLWDSVCRENATGVLDSGIEALGSSDEKEKTVSSA